MNIVLVIPTYNERDNIKPLVEGLQREFGKIENHHCSILFVDDSSPDGTADIVKSTMEQWNNVTMISGPKEGLGKAYTRGINYATKKMNAEVIISMDADLSHDPVYVPKLLSKIDEGDELVLGSRYIKGGTIPGEWALRRKILSWGGNTLVRLLLGLWSIHEFTNSLRAFTVKLHQKMEPKNFSFTDNTFLPAFVLEAVRVGARVKEIPLEFKDRRCGQSKIDVPKYVPNLLKFCLAALLTRVVRLAKKWLGLDKGKRFAHNQD